MPGVIRITDLPLLNGEDPRDIIHFQRLVDGVWQDFYTNFATINGEALTWVYSLDLAGGPISEIIYTPDTDELVVPLALYVVYRAPNVQDGIGASFQAFSGLSNPLDISEFAINNIGGIYNAVDLGEFSDLDQTFFFGYTPTGDVTGTATVYVQYAVIPKI